MQRTGRLARRAWACYKDKEKASGAINLRICSYAALKSLHM